MTKPDLTGKRVLLLGAETDLGAEIARAVAEAGADVAAVAARTETASAFAVQRMVGRMRSLGQRAIAKVIDATNEMAVRVVMRQVGKEFGGIDVVIYCTEEGDSRKQELELAVRLGAKEMARSGLGVILAVGGRSGDDMPTPPKGAMVLHLPTTGKRIKPDQVLLMLDAIPASR